MPKTDKTHCLADIYPDNGSLGGLYTGLSYIRSNSSLVVACDMPFLSISLIGYLFQLSPAYDVVLPRIAGLMEPLHAVYSVSCLPYLRSMMEKGELSILELFPKVNVRYVEQDEIDKFDPEHLSFFNINTEAELQEAKRILKEGKLNIKTL